MNRPARNATITPQPTADACERDDCAADELLALVEPDATEKRRVLCPTHRVLWLREVSDR